MEETVQLNIPVRWLEELSIDQDQLRQALMLGLTQLRQQQEEKDVAHQVVQALLSTGRVHRLPAAPDKDESEPARREPLKLPGMPLSEMLIAQRRGEL